MLEKTLSKLCKIVVIVGCTVVLTNGYSVRAEQSNQTLYHYIMDTYGKQYVNVTNVQEELIKLQDEYRVAEHNNLQAESFDVLKGYSSVVEKEINVKIDDEVYKLKKEQEMVTVTIEGGVVDLTPMELSVLSRKYNKYQERIDSTLKDKTSLSSLFSNTTYDRVDTSSLELSIKEKEAIISYDPNNTSTDLGDIFQVKPPFNYSYILTSHSGYRTDPINGTIKFHDGTDYAMPVGMELYALFNGTVVQAGENGGYGESIKIDCGNGLVVLYGHLSRVDVKVGDKVTQNQVIGLSGNTGRSTGPHLHLSLFYKGEVLDVERLFP